MWLTLLTSLPAKGFRNFRGGTGRANQQLQQRMAQWREQLLTVFQSIMPEDVKLDMASLQLSQVDLEMEGQGIRLNGLATGHIRVEFR